MKLYFRTNIRRTMFAQRGVDGAPERNNIFISTRTLKVAALWLVYTERAAACPVDSYSVCQLARQ